MENCIGPIVILVITAVQIIATVRKNQEQARRRAMGGDAPHRPPPRVQEIERRRPELEESDEVERDHEPLPGWAPKEVPWTPPVPAAMHFGPARVAARATIPIGDAVSRRHRIRLDRGRLRDAIVLSEILAPPVALRRD